MPLALRASSLKSKCHHMLDADFDYMLQDSSFMLNRGRLHQAQPHAKHIMQAASAQCDSAYREV